jgi:P4 family phage/plasmid primase-like protien
MSSRRTEFNKPSCPCPVCGSHSKGCSATDDGLHFCRGTPTSGDWAKLKDHDNGFCSYRNDAEPSADRPTTTARRRTSTPRIDIDWGDKVREYATMFPPLAPVLAAELNLPAEAFDTLPGIGFSAAVDGKPVFCFPERDATGTVVGISERFPPTAEHPRGEKKVRLGGNRGLSIPAGWRDRSGPVFLVEGATDTIAMSHAGLAAVGRPGNKAGIEHLAGLLRDLPADRPLIVVGENDRKAPSAKHPEGEWPGREGAEFTAGRLAAALGRPVLWALTPEPSKDVRAWLTDPVRASTPWADRGAELSGLLVAAASGAEPVAPPDESDDPNKWTHDPADCHRLAAGYLASLSPPGQPIRLRYWREEFHQWQSGCYHTLRDGDLKAMLSGWVKDELRRVQSLELAAWEAKPADTRGPRPKVRDCTRVLIGNVVSALAGMCRVPGDANAPCWLDGARGPDPRHVLAVRNGLYDLADGRFLPHSASFFSFTTTGFDYIPDAPAPAEWTKFLASVWRDEPDSIACLQEWFGYLLTPDTRLQKLLFLLGPTRAGKGTIAQVLKGIVGERSFTGPTLSSLAGEYGLWPLLGRSVALISDARLSARTDTAQVVERILSVTGEDTVTINRKNLPLIDSRLTARFVILSNELPNLTDASGALPARMILLRLSRTFLGAEDTGLADRLLSELPGILLWAIEGFRRLRLRGHFTQPASGSAAMSEMRDISSPVAAFVRERCVIQSGASCDVKDVYESWKKWCEDQGRKEPGTVQIFGRNLTAAYAEVRISNTRDSGSESGRRRVYTGLRLRSEYENIVGKDNGDDWIKPNATNMTTHHQLDDLVRDGTRSRDNAAIRGEETMSESPYSCKGEDRVPSRTTEVDQNEWLYVSKKLELTTLPATQTLEVIHLGGTSYHRISPAVVVWIENAIADRDESGRHFTPDELHAVMSAQDSIYKFARDRFADGELEAARRAGPQPLPDETPVTL